ncbi:hypothetical protein DBO85_09690 [Pseudomonas mangrovi]|uniref:Uncharacterized protein n=1 Tax=Pseudomonas mangrovi TaxID=2161748 RepID=A0A2T5P9E3_9PSED|nr:hypothetical protein DBO85_09690 [Pseudomonas mangrovi]
MLAGALVGFIFGLILFVVGLLLADYNKWHFLLLWSSVSLLFWCFGLLLVNSLYRTLPTRSGRGLSRIQYYWELVMGWYGAIFLTGWFLILTLITMVAPFVIFLAPLSACCG